METLATGLRYWGNKIKTKRGREVKRLNRRLVELNCEEISEENLGEIVEVKLHLNMEMDKEEKYWEQRPRANWLKMGDKNTSFFHKFTSQRRRANQLKALQRRDGSLASDGREMECIARGYFSNLLASRGIGDLGHILSRVHSCVSDQMNQSLLATYKDEIV